MAPQLRTAIVLTEDTSSVPNTHVGGSQTPVTAAPQGLMPLASVGTSCVHT